MSDIGHDMTDGVLDDLEKRIAREYAQAYREVEKKAADYFARFAVKDKQKQALVKSGKLTEKEYKEWRRNQMLTGKRWTDLRDTLAKDLTNTNKIAAAMVRGELNGVFAINANYSEYLIENGMRTNYGFTLYDRDTVANLIKNDPDIIPWKPSVDIPADLRWNRQMITSHITQGILQGESIPNLSKRLLKTVNNNKVAAVRTARTAVTSSENAGRQMVYDRAQAMGIKLQKEWLATLDGRTRHEHGAVDGQTVDLDKPFNVGGYKMMYPADMSAPAHLTMNCRCTTITVEPPHITKGEEPRKTYDEWIAEKGGKEYEKYQGKKNVAEKKVEETKPQAPKKPSDYTDSASVDMRLAELQKEMDASNDFERWVEIEKEQTALIERKNVLLQQESRQRAKEIQQRIYEKDYFATKGMGKGYSVNLDGADEKSMLDIEKALDSVFNKFPSLKNKFSGISVVDDLPQGAMASCGKSFGEVSLSRVYFGNNSKISTAWQKCVENGFHPIGTSPHAAVVHEFGHSVDHFITRRGDIFNPKYIGRDATASTTIKKNVFKKLGISNADVSTELSAYATMNDKEFVAEAFAEYVTSPTPRPIAVAVGEEIEKMLGGLL